MIEWLDDFYGDPELRETMIRSALPLFSSFSQSATGGPVDSNFIAALAEAYVDRYLDSSRAQLQEVIKGSDNPLAALAERFNEWDEKRPEKVAQNEMIRSANAAQVQQFRDAGVEKMVWRASGGACPFCNELDGVIISVTGTFFEKGDTLAPEGVESPINFQSTIGHPPVHQGCTCFVEAVTETDEEVVLGDPDTRPPEMVAWEDEIRVLNPKVEHGAVFDADGKMLWSGEGTRKGVSIPDEFLRPGYQVTHSHPGTNFQLSAADVALAIDRNLGYVRAFTADGRWTEVRTNGYGFGSSRFVNLFKTAMKTEEREYRKFTEQLLGAEKPTKALQAVLDDEWFAATTRAVNSAAETLGFTMRTNG